MQFGIAFANVLGYSQPEGAARLGMAAEAAGFESLWTVEHTFVPQGYESTYPYDASGKMPAPDDFDMPDPLIWLAYVAARTERIKLATGILIVPQRNPGVLAKELATLDVLSGGRMVLGVGAGWLAEEFAALGIPFDDRGKRLDASIEAMRALWGEAPTTLHNAFVDYDRIFCRPAPVRGTIPVHVGGHTEVAARRAGRIGDGFFPGEGDIPALIEVVKRSADAAGRDPEAIEISTIGLDLLGPEPLAAVEKARAAGIHRLAVPSFGLALDHNQVEDQLAAFGEKVIAQST